MKQPGFLARFAGYWPVTVLLLCLYALIEYGWYRGRVGLLPAVMVVGLTMGTVRAFFLMVNYRQFDASWNAMGEMSNGVQAPRKSARGIYLLGLVLLVAIPFAFSHIPNHPRALGSLFWLWAALCAAACLLVFFKITRGGFSLVRGSMHRGRMKSDAKANAAPVSWMLGRATGSPSRKAATRQLPSYTRALMNEKSMSKRLQKATPVGGKGGR